MAITVRYRSLLLAGAVAAATALTVPPAAAASGHQCRGFTATIVGTARDDRLIGTAGRDIIVGGRGDDYIVGDDGDDVICTGPGDDVVRAGRGDDQLFGQAGRDRLHGGPGRDTMHGGRGSDVLRGGSGWSRLTGGPGRDRLYARGGGRLAGGRGVDRYEGGTRQSNSVTVTFRSERGPVRVDLRAGTASTPDGVEAVVNIDNVAGTRFNDVLKGNGRPNLLWGNRGRDRLVGRGGNDVLRDRHTLIGGAGNDVLVTYGRPNVSGGRGRDHIVLVRLGSPGTASIRGGAGRDSMRTRIWDSLHVDLARGRLTTGDWTATLAGIESVFSGSGDDTIIGTDGPNRLFGGLGNDTINGRAGDDVLSGGDGVDTLTGGRGHDVCLDSASEFDDRPEAFDCEELRS